MAADPTSAADHGSRTASASSSDEASATATSASSSEGQLPQSEDTAPSPSPDPATASPPSAPSAPINGHVTVGMNGASPALTADQQLYHALQRTSREQGLRIVQQLQDGMGTEEILRLLEEGGE